MQGPGGARGGGGGGALNLVEERQGLVGRKLDGSMQGGDVILLEAQAQQDRCLQVRQVGRNMAAEVGLGQPWQQVQNDMMVYKVIGVRLSNTQVVWRQNRAASASN